LKSRSFVLVSQVKFISSSPANPPSFLPVDRTSFSPLFLLLMTRFPGCADELSFGRWVYKDFVRSDPASGVSNPLSWSSSTELLSPFVAKCVDPATRFGSSVGFSSTPSVSPGPFPPYSPPAPFCVCGAFMRCVPLTGEGVAGHHFVFPSMTPF